MPQDPIISKKTGKNKSEKKPKGRQLSKELRKCPSCKLLMIETRLYGLKISVQCRNCSLKYNFTKYPAFIEIDYYYKMREAFSKDVKDGVIIPPITASAGRVVGSCPLCKIGNLAIDIGYNRRVGIRCENTDCQAKFGLPSKGYFQGAGSKCSACDWPLLTWEFKSTKASSFLCFNPDCRFRSKWTYMKKPQ